MRVTVIGVVALAILAMASAALADADPEPLGLDQYPSTATSIQEETRKQPVFMVDITGEWVARAGIDDSEASFAYAEYFAGLKWQLLLLNFDHRRYDWHGGPSPGGTTDRDPWDSFTRIAPGVQYYLELGDSWGLWPKFAAIAGFEDSISSRSWTYNPQFVGFYRYSEQMTLYAGAGVLYHPVDSVAYPVLGVAWRLGGDGRLSGAVGFPETMVRYEFNENFFLKLDFQWDIRTYRLADDNPLAAQGFVRTEERIPGLHLAYSPCEGVTLSPGVRWHLGRSLEVFDRNEKKLSAMDVDSSWAAVFEVSYDF